MPSPAENFASPAFRARNGACLTSNVGTDCHPNREIVGKTSAWIAIDLPQSSYGIREFGRCHPYPLESGNFDYVRSGVLCHNISDEQKLVANESWEQELRSNLRLSRAAEAFGNLLVFEQK